MFKNNKNKDKFDLYKTCCCNQQKSQQNTCKKQANSYESIKKKMLHMRFLLIFTGNVISIL